MLGGVIPIFGTSFCEGTGSSCPAVRGIKAVARKMRIIAIIGFSERHVDLLPNFAVLAVGVVVAASEVGVRLQTLFAALAIGVANCVLRVLSGFTAYICGSCGWGEKL